MRNAPPLSTADPAGVEILLERGSAFDAFNSIQGGSAVKTAIGCDLGIKKLLALSNGELIKNPQFEKRLSKRKTIRQRRLSRKKRGSSTLLGVI